MPHLSAPLLQQPLLEEGPQQRLAIGLIDDREVLVPPAAGQLFHVLAQDAGGDGVERSCRHSEQT